MSVPESAMVLAAGLGRRMRPLTVSRPKPLIQVAGATLLDHVLRRVEAAGMKRVVVNVHYLADQIEAHLARRKGGVEIAVSDERERLLETGGGVARAMPLIQGDPFYVINSDNFWIDGARDTMVQLAERWDAGVMDALLLVVPLARAIGYEGKGDFHMDAWGRLRRRAERRVAPYVFSGVQILSRRLMEGAPDGAFSLNWAYDRALEAERLYGLSHTGLWFHVGTPQAVRNTETALAGG